MLQITGKHIDVTEAIRQHAEELFAKIEEHEDLSDKSLSFGKERHLYSVVAQCKTSRGFEATASAKDEDCYKAMNQAVKKLKKQVDKHHSKATDKSHRTLNDIAEEVEELHPAV